MNNTLKYRGYIASVEFDPRDSLFVGRVLGIPESITFQGDKVTDLIRDFHAAVRHYLADCKAMGRKTAKSYSGKILLRLSPKLHARVALAAEARGKSINQWAAEALAKAE